MLRYFPSCKFTAALPDVSERAKEYMAARGAEVMGCCRPGHKDLAAGDTVVTVCETCNIIVSENRPDVFVISLSEFVDADPDSVFPSFAGERITVQDCFRARERQGEKAAVRSLLSKMGFDAVELSGSEEEGRFDGTFLYTPLDRDNLRLAPLRFSGIEKAVTPLGAEERAARLRAYCRRFETERVCCYCNTCLKGLAEGLGPGRAVHIAELLFGPRA